MKLIALTLSIVAALAGSAAAQPTTAPLPEYERRRLAGEAANQPLYEMYREARALLARGDFGGALVIYEKLSGKSLWSDCGNASAGWRDDINVNKGICLEQLGRFHDATPQYFSALGGWSSYATDTATHRLSHMYASGGQIERLRSILDQWDKSILDRSPNIVAAGVDLPSAGLRSMLKLYELDQNGQWQDLLEFLASKESPWSDIAPHGDGNFEKKVAARMLSRYPDKAVPAIRKALEDRKSVNIGWLYYVLGLINTPDSLQILRSAAGAAQEDIIFDAIFYALSISGPKGEAFIAELNQTSRYDRIMEEVVGRIKFYDATTAKFPVPPRDVKLPAELATAMAKPSK